MAICNVYTFPLSGDTENMNAYSHALEIEVLDCTPTCDYTVMRQCDELWNCQNQSNTNDYFNPVIAGDKFMFQTKFVDFYNADPASPATGWTAGGLGFVTAELLNPDGTLISDDHATFASRYLIGYTSEQSYQVIEIDYDLLLTNYPAVNCFSFKFVAYNSSNVEVDSICTEHFQPLPNDCKDTILIASETSTDCCDNIYSKPDNDTYVGNARFAYNNVWRYHAGIRRINTEFSKTVFGVKRTKVELDRIFRLQLKRLIPPYLFNYLTEIHLAGERVYIDGEEYYIDEFSFDNESERKMFIGQIELFQDCDTNFKC